MKLTFLGAVRTVTGSMHLLEVNGSRILLDCGLYQGHREESNLRNRKLPLDPRSIDVVVLSHAHIDHSGNLPQLARQGFSGIVYTTPASRDLCSAMLRDSAYIQEQDAKFLNKNRSPHAPPIEPLYDYADVLRVMERMIAVPYRARIPIAPNVGLTFHDAGHILGSAIVVLDAEERGVKRRIGFTGDLGRRGSPILRDPERPLGLDVLITESTYGGRLHDSFDQAGEDLARVLTAAADQGSKVIVPSFAVGRAQDLVYIISKLQAEKRIPVLPIYVDSPLTVDVTEIHRLHPECYDEEVRRMIEAGGQPFGFHNMTYIRHVEDSKALNEMRGPMVIISASGMAETGRILHHLRNNIEDARNTILIVGYQAHGTLGRRLVEKEEEVRIFGEPHRVRARVKVLNSLSAHADQRELLDWILNRSDPGKRVYIVHGDSDQSEALAAELQARGASDVAIPEFNVGYAV
jgi:metallo-beta-lactamase family protein